MRPDVGRREVGVWLHARVRRCRSWKSSAVGSPSEARSTSMSMHHKALAIASISIGITSFVSIASSLTLEPGQPRAVPVSRAQRFVIAKGVLPLPVSPAENAQNVSAKETASVVSDPCNDLTFRFLNSRQCRIFRTPHLAQRHPVAAPVVAAREGGPST
jgi:hypothetical protein